MVVAGHHVFCTEISVRNQLPSARLFDERAVAFRDVVCADEEAEKRKQRKRCSGDEPRSQLHAPIISRPLPMLVAVVQIGIMRMAVQ